MSDARETALAYLQSHHVMTLATAGADGVWAAAVFYDSDGFTLSFLSAAHTRHAQAIAANPRVAATIQDDTADWQVIQGVQLSGTVEQLQGATREAALGRYQDKYPFIAQPIPALQAALAKVNWYQLVPDTVYFIDNSKGFGHRDLVLGSAAGES